MTNQDRATSITTASPRRRAVLPAVLVPILVLILIGCAAPGADTGNGERAAATPPAAGAGSGPDLDDDRGPMGPAPGMGGGPTTGRGPQPMPADPTDPDQPVTSEPQPPAGAPPAAGDGALAVEPEPGIVGARPHQPERVVISPDGRSLVVYYWGGVQDCYGLDRVDVVIGGDGRPQVTVFEGWRANLGAGVACIDIGLLKSVTVELDNPIAAPAD